MHKHHRYAPHTEQSFVLRLQDCTFGKEDLAIFILCRSLKNHAFFELI
jgi:hypothetical protein